MKTSRTTAAPERVLLVGVGVKKMPHLPGVEAGEAERESLAELEELARSAGAEVAGSIFQMRDAVDPATIVGRGKLEEVKIEAQMHQAPLVVFDRNLTPGQQRNIERAIDCRVIDRTQLILDLFARHARSREGQLQVELAQLNYLLPRLTVRGVELSRLGGGIGTRGPGEQK
ncbi:MAG: GTPase HflX, partial [Acidobacteria bacterium]|nr:GTPase HflX [Acidobacteriota bacterium]